MHACTDNQLVPALQKQAPMPDPAPSLQPTGALLSATLDSIKQSPPTPLRNEKGDYTICIQVSTIVAFTKYVSIGDNL